MEEKKHGMKKQNIASLLRMDDAVAGGKNKSLIVAYIIKGAFIIYASILPVAAIADPLKSEFSIRVHFAAAIITLSVLLALETIKRKSLKRLVFIILMISFTYLNYERIAPGYVAMFRELLQYAKMDYLLEGVVMAGEISYALVHIEIILFSILFYSTWKYVNPGIHILATVPLYAMSYIIGITPPGYIAIGMCAYYMSVFNMFRSDMRVVMDGGRSCGVNLTKKVTVQTGVITVLMFLAATAAASAIESESEYKKNNFYINMRIKLEDFFAQYDGGNIFRNKRSRIATAGMGYGALGNADILDMHNDEELLIRAHKPLKGKIYLRGFTAGKYATRKENDEIQNSWDTELSGMIDLYKENKTLFYNVMIQGYYLIDKAVNSGVGIGIAEKYEKNPIVVDAYDPEKHQYAYFPYNASKGRSYDTVVDGSMFTDMDPYPSGQRADSFELYQTDFKIPYSAYEKLAAESRAAGGGIMSSDDIDVYGKFVRKYYMEVPKELNRFHEKFDGMSFANLDACVNYIRQYLSSTCKYSLSPGRHADGDFVENFLFDKKKGYCTYFATATVLMLRQFGYPARYAEGYAAYGNGEKTVVVIGKNAHAWAEVYIDGYGWIPVETTPGYGDDIGGEDNRETTKPAETNSETATNTQPQTTDSETTIRETANSETTVRETVAGETTEFVTTDGENESTVINTEHPPGGVKRKNPALSVIIIIPAAVGFVIFSILWRRKIKYRRIERLLADNDPRKRIAAIEKMFTELIKSEHLHINKTASLERKSEIIEWENGRCSYEEIYNIFILTDMARYTPDDYFSEAGEYDVMIDKAAATVSKMTQSFYDKQNIFSRFLIKYIKCLYLNEK